MPKEIVAVFSEKAIEHNPSFGTFDGIQRPSWDQPERAQVIIRALRDLNATSQIQIAQPREFEMPVIYTVHDQAYIDYLKFLSLEMAQKPPIMVAEIDPVSRQAILKEYPAFTYPSVFPHGLSPRTSNHQAEKGVYSYDIATPIMGNTYEIALLSAFTAITGADMIKHGKSLVYALCRPPGHHADPSRMGSYCYINNAAIAAQYLFDQTKERVAIIDIDAHHGNGTQEVFYESSNVFYASLHGDPTKTHPYFSGYSDEKGKGTGFGYNLNIPLPIGSTDVEVLNALDSIICQIRQFSPKYLVVSLGFDGMKEDPARVFSMTTEGYAEAAKKIGLLALPTLSVQEGGYSLQSLGKNVVSFLRSLAENTETTIWKKI